MSGVGGISIQVNLEEGTVKEPWKAARYLKADAGYFRTMGIQLLQGRLMAASDDSVAPAVMVVSARMARELWPGQNPLGKRIKLLDPDTVGWRSVIGVVSDVREKPDENATPRDRKSTRLNSSHPVISYAVFSLKKTN